MSNSNQIRPGGDFDIVQARVVRGCDVQLATEVPGDLLLFNGRNNANGNVSTILVNNRTNDRDQPVLGFVHGADVLAGELVELYVGALATPDGVVTAAQGSLYISSNPAAVYQNTDGVTTWVAISDVTGGENLNETLAIGNFTGGLNIQLDPGDFIQGADNALATAGDIRLRGGNATGPLGDGGGVFITSGATTAGVSGAIEILTASVTGALDSGDLTVGTGVTDAGSSGQATLQGGVSTTGRGGNARILGGDTSVVGGVFGGFATVQAGSAILGGAGGHTLISAGHAVAPGPLAFLANADQGGFTRIAGGDSGAARQGGDVLLQGGVGGAAGGAGGDIVLAPGLGGGGAAQGIIDGQGILQASNIQRGTLDPNIGGVIGAEGDVYQRTLGGQGELWLNVDGITWVQLGASGAFWNAFTQSQWGTFQAAGDTNPAGDLIDATGFWAGAVEDFGGAALAVRGFDDFGPRIRATVGAGQDFSINLSNLSTSLLTTGHNFATAFRWQNDVNVSTNSLIYIGLSTSPAVTMLGSNLPVGQYVGLQKLDGFAEWRFISRGLVGTSVPAGQFTLPVDDLLTLIIDCSLTDTVVFTVTDSAGNVLQSATTTIPGQIPDSAAADMVPIWGCRSTGDAQALHFYSANAVTQAQNLSVGGGAGGGVAPTLESVLTQSNNTGANSIQLDHFFPLFGGLIVGEDDAPGAGGEGGSVTVFGGNTTGAGLNGGNVGVFSGSAGPGGAGRTGAVAIASRDNLDVGNSGTTGDLSLRTGNHAGTGDSGFAQLSSGTTDTGTSGQVEVASGFSTSGNSGDVQVTSGNAAGTAGNVSIQPGDSTSGPGATVNIEAGGGGGAGGTAGQVLIAAGDPDVGTNLDGGAVSLTGSDAAGTGDGGGVNLLGALGGPVSGAGGEIALTAGNAQAGNSDGGDITLTPGTETGTGNAGVVSVVGSQTVSQDLSVTNDVFVGGKLTVVGLIDPTGLVLEEQVVNPYDPTGTTQGTLWIRDTAPQELVFTNNNGVDTVLGSGDGGGGGGSITAGLLTAGYGFMAPGSPTEGSPATYGIYGSSQASSTINSTILVTTGQDDGPIADMQTAVVPGATARVNTAQSYIARRQLFRARFKFRATSGAFTDHRMFIGFTDSPGSQLGNDDPVAAEYVGLINRENSLDFEFVARGSVGAIAPVTTITADNDIHYLDIDCTDNAEIVFTLLAADGITVEATHTEPTGVNVPGTGSPLSPFSGIISPLGSSVKSLEFHYHSIITRADVLDALGGGGSGGPLALNDLTDVNAPAPAATEVLTWNGAQWVNLPAGGGGGGETLAQTLALGNVSGGLDITLSPGDRLTTSDAAAPGDLELRAGDAVPGSGANGAAIVQRSGSGDATGPTNGGGYQIFSGAAGTTGNGGTYQAILGSGGSTSGNGGSFFFQTGQAAAGNSQGGDAAFSLLGGSGTGRGGQFSITTGDGGVGGGDGGTIFLNPGAGNGGGADGQVFVDSDLTVTGKLNVAGLIDPTGLVLNRQGAQPVVPTVTEGLLWVDNVGDLFYDTNLTSVNISALATGGASSLAATLAVGSTTGANDINVSAGQSVAFGAGSWINFIETATVPGGPPGATNGKLWVQNSTPNVLVFTDDAGADTILGAAGGTQTLAQALTAGPTTGGNRIVLGSSTTGAPAGNDIITAEENVVLTIQGSVNNTPGPHTPPNIPGSVFITSGVAGTDPQVPGIFIVTPNGPTGPSGPSGELLLGTGDGGDDSSLLGNGAFGGNIQIGPGSGGDYTGVGNGNGGLGGSTLFNAGGDGGRSPAANGGGGGSLLLSTGNGGDTGAGFGFSAGNAGSVILSAGDGGACTSTGDAGDGGQISISSGTAGSSAGGNNGDNGNIVLSAAGAANPFTETGAVIAVGASDGADEGAALALGEPSSSRTGDATLQAGTGTSGSEGGDVFIHGGDIGAPTVITPVFSPNRGGDVQIRGGAGDSGASGGSVTLVGGLNGPSGGTAGHTFVTGRDARNASGGGGGDIRLRAGSGDGGGADGQIELTGTVNWDGQLNPNGTGLKRGRVAANTGSNTTTVTFPGLPMSTSSPHILITIESSSGSSPTSARILSASISTTGFQVRFSSTPNVFDFVRIVYLAIA